MSEDMDCEGEITKHRGILNSMSELDDAIDNLMSLVMRLVGDTSPDENKKACQTNEVSLVQFLSSTRGRIAEQAKKINEEVEKLDGMLL